MNGYKKLDDIDWQNWRAQDVATLLFVIKDGQILLIRKKRGIGAGKVNGPGGRIEAGESPMECAVREVEEEVCVTPTGISHCGELSFQFTDGYSLHGSIFIADGYRGTPCATAEADPFWVDIDKIPYDQMWADDIHWIPHILEGKAVRGWFLFEGEDKMLEHKVNVTQT